MANKREGRPGKDGPNKINRAAAESVYTVRESAGKCDFCGDPRPAWRFPACDFTRSVNGNTRCRFASVGPWAACQPCRDLIEAGQWARLRRRFLRLFHAAAPGLSPAASVPVAADLAPLWLQFQQNRTGPAERVNGGAS
jgi:hypothetical protein